MKTNGNLIKTPGKYERKTFFCRSNNCLTGWNTGWLLICDLFICVVWLFLFHPHLFRTQAASVFGAADSLSCKVPGVFPSAGPPFVVQLPGAHSNTRTLVGASAARFLPAAERKGKLWHASPTLPARLLERAEKNPFRAKPSKFVRLLVFGGQLTSTQPVPVPARWSRHARGFLFDPRQTLGQRNPKIGAWLGST